MTADFLSGNMVARIQYHIFQKNCQNIILQPAKIFITYEGKKKGYKTFQANSNKDNAHIVTAGMATLTSDKVSAPWPSGETEVTGSGDACVRARGY